MEYPAFSSGRASVRKALRAHSFIRNPLGCQSQYPLCHLRTRLLPLVPKSVLTKKGECFWGMKCRSSHEIGSKAGGPQSGADHLQRRSSSGSGSISSGKGKKRASDTESAKETEEEGGTGATSPWDSRVETTPDAATGTQITWATALKGPTASSHMVAA